MRVRTRILDAIHEINFVSGPFLLNLSASGAALIVAGVVASRWSNQIHLHFDEAWNLHLVRTLVRYGVYGTQTFHISYRYFDPFVTTGPTVTIPFAVYLAFCGVTLSCARAVGVLLFLASFSLILFSLAGLYGAKFAALFLVLLMATPGILSEGLRAMAEVPALALLIAGATSMARTLDMDLPRREFTAEWLHPLIAGVAWGLALLAKLTSAVFLLGAGVTLLIRARQGGHRLRTQRVVLALIVPPAMVAVWRVYQLLSVRVRGPESVAIWNRMNSQFMEMQRKLVFSPGTAVAENAKEAFEAYGPFIATFVGCLIGIIVLLWQFPLREVAGSKRGPEQAKRATTEILLGGSSAWYVWYFFLSGKAAYERHLLIAVALSVIAAMRFLVQAYTFCRGPSIDSTVRRRTLLFVPMLATAILLFGGMVTGIGRNIAYLAASSRIREAQLTTAAWVRRNVAKDDRIVGYGWYQPWDITFLADRLVTEYGPDVPLNEQGPPAWLILPPEIKYSRQEFPGLWETIERNSPAAFADGPYEVFALSETNPGPR